MIARYVLTVLAGLFLVLGTVRVKREGGRLGPASRSWLLAGTLFALAAVWLWRTT